MAVTVHNMNGQDLSLLTDVGWRGPAAQVAPSQKSMEAILYDELSMLDGIHSYNPETGVNVEGGALLKQYTNRLFGAPFQLLDSVDRRFPGINEHVGSEYLRNFLLNSPILYIKPGMPYYTGDRFGEEFMRDVFVRGIGVGTALVNKLSSVTLFRSGAKLQRRLFGFREQYMNYMTYVNYMCRAVSMYMGFDDDSFNMNGMMVEASERRRRQPLGIYATTQKDGTQQFVTFDRMRWENYRMFDTYVPSISEYAKMILGAAGKDLVAPVLHGVGSIGNLALAGLSGLDKLSGGVLGSTLDTVADMSGASKLTQSIMNVFNSRVDDMWSEEEKFSFHEAVGSGLSNIFDSMKSFNTYEGRTDSLFGTTFDLMNEKVKSVSFMVEPVSPADQLNNQADDSMIPGLFDQIDQGLGKEIAFITGSHADVGALGELTKFVGSTAAGVAEGLGSLTRGLSGGFTNSLFSGALGAIKGQKMIYPKIYKDSTSKMSYSFDVTLATPYGDNYNYYVHVLVPLLHLIALAAPRMISSNSISSPFIVQCYIPGMCTCQMGIISDMNIVKNPSLDHVSVNGFPLSVKVTFTVEELYNNLSISPYTDPASFQYNETLNDYMANLAGLIPSATSYIKKKEALFDNIVNYFTGDGIWADVSSGLAEGLENFFMGVGT